MTATSPDGIRHGPFIWLTVVLCAASAGFYGWLGGFAAMVFRLYWGVAFPLMRVAGLLLGLAAGALAGMAWCGAMTCLAVRSIRRAGRCTPRLIAWGAFAGHAASLLAVAILLGGMLALAGRTHRWAILGGLAYSAVAGLTFSALGGLLTWGAASLAAPPGRTDAKARGRAEAPSAPHRAADER